MRSAKYQNIVETVRKPGLEFVKIDEIATDDFTEALEGIDVVLHLACPLPGRKSLDETFNVKNDFISLSACSSQVLDRH